MSKIKISFFHNVELDELITKHPTCNYPSCNDTELFGLVTSKCIVIFVGRGAHQNFFLSKIKISFFQNVELEELITNHSTCNYPSCIVTELFVLVTSKCIVIFVEGGHQNFFLSKIKISFFQNVELDELITNHPNYNYLSCTVTELFGLVTSKCIVIFFSERASLKIFFVQNQNFFFSQCRAQRADHESPHL